VNELSGPSERKTKKEPVWQTVSPRANRSLTIGYYEITIPAVCAPLGGESVSAGVPVRQRRSRGSRRSASGTRRSPQEFTRLSRRTISLIGLAAALTLVVVSIRCDYSSSAPPSVDDNDSLPTVGSLPGQARTPTGMPELANIGQRRDDDTRKALLDSAMTLIQRAALQPGGDNFKLAVQKLNQYFEGTAQSEYELDSASREYLRTQFPPRAFESLSDRNWTDHDTRHIEDCMMYYPIATRIAGTGENLARVRRVFAWAMQQVQLVPPGRLALGGLPQAYGRPYDVLLRGMATEAQGVWAERAWLFLALCRQLEIDAGLVTYSRSRTLEPRVPRYGLQFELDAALRGIHFGPKPPIVWICAVIIDDKAYLFDARLGLEVPGKDGTGVATLEDALTDPAVLDRMSLPGDSPYQTSRASLLGSPTKIGILFDSSPGYFAPKMKLLQRELTGEFRTILFRDPAEQRDHFAQVLGERCGDIKPWRFPLEVHTRLFNDGQFVEAVKQTLVLFKREYPLVYARVKHLRGDMDGAVKDYLALRFVQHAPLVTDKKATIPPEIQAGLDAYATYYLALAQLEKARLENRSPDLAEELFRNTLNILPNPGLTDPYYYMFRWGANANLGRIHEARKDDARALAYYTQFDPTTQGHGNLVRARELAWRSPIAAAKVVLPPAPPLRPIVTAPAAPPANPGSGRGPGAGN
jgi:hypothetical protein